MTRSILWSPCLAFPLLLAGAPASAQEVVPTEVGQKEMALLPIKTSGEGIDEVKEPLDELFLTAVEEYDDEFVVIGYSDIQALINLESQKQLLGCEDDSCLAEIGGALGVERMIAVEVARVDGEWVTTATLINTLTVVAEARTSVIYVGEPADYLETIPSIIEELFRRTPFYRGMHPAYRYTEIALGGVGLLAAGAGTYFGLKARSDHNRATSTTEPGGQKFVSSGRTNQRNANIAFIASAVLVVASATVLTLEIVGEDDDEPQATTNLSVGAGAVVLPQGFGITVSLGY